MPKTIEVLRYSFEELSPEAQEKAIDYEVRGLTETVSQTEIEEVLLNNLAVLLTGDSAKKPTRFEFQEWNLNCQGRTIILGEIKKEDAPLLTWPDCVSGVLLQDGDYAGQIIAVQDLEGSTDYSEELATAREIIIPQIYEVLNSMMGEGKAFYKMITSREIAKDSLTSLDDNDAEKYVFLPDGTYDAPKNLI